LDESSSSNGGTNFVNSIISPFPQVINRFRGLSDFNVANNLVINGLYTLPSPKSNGLKKVVGEGFQLGGILRSATGLPFTPLITGDPLGLSNNNQFSLPDRITTGSCAGNPVNLKDKANYLRRECFAFPTNIPTPGGYFPRLGNLRRNSIIGPGINTTDMSLVKITPVPSISEAFRVEFRTEVFNIFNHPNFVVPTRTSAAVFNASGTPLSPAVLTQTSTPERQIQFGLKIIF
jgi:hypothetical protein